MPQRISGISAWATAAALVALVGWSFWQHWLVLSSSPFPLGVDGYFYPIQVRSLLEHGVLQYPASPLTFWWMTPFAAATDPIIGAKLGAALGGALVAIPAFLVGARLGNGRAPGLLAAVIAAASAGSAYLTIEFVKQGIGLTVALTALWLVLRALESPTWRRLIAVAIGLVAAVLAHKLAAAFVVIVGVPAAIVEVRARGRRVRYAIGGALVLIAIACVLGAMFPQRFVSASDLALLRHLVTSHARWAAPALVMPNLTIAFDHEAAIGAVLGIVAAVALARRRAEDRPADRCVAWIIVAIAIGIGVPWLAVTDPQGLGFRLRAAAFVPLALCAAIAVRSVPAHVRRLGDVVIVAIAAMIAIVQLPTERTEGVVLAHPALVAAALALDDQLPSNATVIVPERHIAFMVAWYARATISLRPEAIPYPQRVRLLPLNFFGADSALDHALDAARHEPTLVAPLGVHPRHRNGLVLVTEPTWDWILAHLPPDEREYFARWHTI